MPPFTSSAQAVLECYKIFGTACTEHLDGAFAFAIYDEELREVMLARDREGKKPLYYTTARGVFAFASEIPGLQAYFESGIKVNVSELERQMREPYEKIGTGRIFPEIEELREGSFAVYSRLGFENFTYNTGYIPESSRKVPYGILPPLSEKSLEGNALAEILRAFGHPFFNYQFLRILEFARRERQVNRILSVEYEDDLVRVCEKIAFEAADRIGMLFGIMLYPKLPESEVKTKRRELKRIEKKLCEMCAKLSVFGNPVGARVYRAALEENDISRKIGMLGMILQAEHWIERDNIIFV